MSDAAKLKDLYAAVPSFACKPGCADCCGPVPVAKAEWQKIKLAKKQVGVDCLSCDYLVDSKCSVYNDRPFLCRLFGATADSKMSCKHGCGPEKPLSLKQTEILMKRYMSLMKGGPAALTASIDSINILANKK
jgi:Fe-S-cluster containining protein